VNDLSLDDQNAQVATKVGVIILRCQQSVNDGLRRGLIANQKTELERHDRQGIVLKRVIVKIILLLL
jgi:hypothetical protein